MEIFLHLLNRDGFTRCWCLRANDDGHDAKIFLFPRVGAVGRVRGRRSAVSCTRWLGEGEMDIQGAAVQRFRVQRFLGFDCAPQIILRSRTVEISTLSTWVMQEKALDVRR